MAGSVIILGANGRFGRAATQAFCTAGWDVTAFARNPLTDKNPAVKMLQGDARDAEALKSACNGFDVIVNALNPPYEKWQELVPVFTRNVIDAARASSATVLIPGNVYNYGRDMPAVLQETTPHSAQTSLGQMRIEMETAFRKAAQDGIQTIILRGGDFIEKEKTGNWFDAHIANKALDGRTTYPGPLNAKHAWAYLPDMARAMVGLANKRQGLVPFCEFGFGGFGLTGAELIAEIERATGVKQKSKTIPWPVITIMALFSARMRKVLEMRYLWQVRHEIDGSLLESTLPEFEQTPIRDALVDAVGKAGT